jgi:hypothetical protein
MLACAYNDLNQLFYEHIVNTFLSCPKINTKKVDPKMSTTKMFMETMFASKRVGKW